MREIKKITIEEIEDLVDRIDLIRVKTDEIFFRDRITTALHEFLVDHDIEFEQEDPEDSLFCQ